MFPGQVMLLFIVSTVQTYRKVHMGSKTDGFPCDAREIGNHDDFRSYHDDVVL